MMCKVEGCNERRYMRGMCRKHYSRWRKHGDATGGRAFDGEPERFLKETAANFDDPTACLIWPFGNPKTRYPRLNVDGRMQSAHRVICEWTHGAPPTAAHQAAHSCGRSNCVSKHHLSWKTSSENNYDKIAHGTIVRGERSGKARLKESEARQILALKGKIPAHELAKRFGVGKSTVFHIHNRESWAWL